MGDPLLGCDVRGNVEDRHSGIDHPDGSPPGHGLWRQALYGIDVAGVVLCRCDRGELLP